MADQIMINFQADDEIKGKLLDIANANQRTMSAQMRFMIEREWNAMTIAAAAAQLKTYGSFPDSPLYSPYSEPVE